MDIFVGRKKELTAISTLLRQNKGVALVAGESGIGKSRFITRVYEINGRKPRYFVMKHECRYSENAETPLVDLLASLIVEAGTSQIQQHEGTAGMLSRTGSILNLICRSFGVGSEIAKELIQKSTLVWGPLEIRAESVFNIASDAWTRMTETVPSISSARQMISEHPSAFIDTYTEVLKALTEDLPDRKFLLILDQLERANSTTLDILLDLVEAIPKRVYLVLAFQTEIDVKTGGSDYRLENYSRFVSGISRVAGNIIELPGLEPEEIGEWVEKRRHKRLTILELKSIQKASGGLPLLIEEWLELGNLEVRDLQRVPIREYLNRFYERRIGKLELTILDFARRLSVLREPLVLEDYVVLVNLEGVKVNISDCDYFSRQLTKSLVFGKEGWFRHETIKDYVEKSMPASLSRSYHSLAAKFFQMQREKGGEACNPQSENWWRSFLNETYHRGGQGLLTHEEIYSDLLSLSSWDFKSLEDITSKIELIERFYEYFHDMGDRLYEARVILWLGRAKQSQARLSPSLATLLTEAESLYRRSLDLSKSLQSKELIAENLECLAGLEWGRKHYVGAIDLFKESLNYSVRPRVYEWPEHISKTSRIAEILYYLSYLEYSLGNIRLAKRYGRKCLRLLGTLKGAHCGWDLYSAIRVHYSISDQLYLFGQIYEANREYKKAVIVYGLMENCYPDFKRYKNEKTVIELLTQLKERVGQRRFTRYLNELEPLSLGTSKDVALLYKVIDTINDKILGAR